MADRSTIYEVAKRSGVSTATVSRVMADGKGFSASTRERVHAIAAEQRSRYFSPNHDFARIDVRGNFTMRPNGDTTTGQLDRPLHLSVDV